MAIALSVLLAGCWGTRGPGAVYYGELLESLAVPPGWELAHTRLREGMFGPNPCGPGDFSCPSAHHYFRVSGQPSDAYPAARQLLIDAGFEIVRENVPCGDPRHGPAACRIEAARGADIAVAYLIEPGLDLDELGIAREGFSIIELRAYQDPEER